MSYETDTTSPWSWSFNFPNASAFYQFYTIACDNASNEEAAPTAADTICAYDAERPTILDTSALTGTTGELFSVTATVLDNLSLDHVYFVYWFGTESETNISMGGNPRTYSVLMPANSLNVLHYRITAVDHAGNWNVTATRHVPVSDNDPPTADAGPDQTVETGVQVTFNGTGSADNIGILNYTWNFTHNGTAITLYGAAPSFIFWENVNHTVTLIVQDGAGNTETDTVNILVLRETLSPPVADAGNDATIHFGEIFTFDGSGSTDDLAVTNYTWAFTYNNTLTYLYGQSPSFRFFANGDYTVTLTVRDADGSTATDTVLVHVESLEQPNGGGLTDYWWVVILILAASMVALYFFFKKTGDKDSQREHDDESDDEDDEDDKSTEQSEGEPLTAQQPPADVQSAESPPK
jgi:PKD repeat protein